MASIGLAPWATLLSGKTMTDEYMIGTTEENMVLVYGLVSVKAAPPGGSAVEPYSLYRTASSGLKYGDGPATCKWVFATMTPAFFSAMMAYLGTAVSANVYIKTRKDDNTFSTYTAIMHRPILDETMSWKYGRWHDVTFEFTNLEEK